MQIKPVSLLFTALLAFCQLVGSEAGAGSIGTPQVTRHVLANGLEVIVIPDTRAPVVTHMVWYKVGSADEQRGKSGIAHFLEHLLFKGTKTVPEREFSQKVAEIGGEENAFTTTDYTAYYQKISPQALPMVMRYEADRMQNLVLTQANVAPELQVILEERRQRVDASPEAILGEAVNAALYANHPYGIPVIGWESEMQELTLDDAIEFYNRYYTPNNAILVVAGDVEPAAVLTLAEASYGRLKRRADPGIRVRPKEPEPTSARQVSYADPRVANPSMRRVYAVPSYRTAGQGEAEALDVLAAILGGSSTSRINKALLLDDPIASSAGAYYEGGYYDGGEFGVYVEPLPGKDMQQAETRLDRLIEQIVRHGVSEAEVEIARDALIRTTIFERDSQTAMAQVYGTVLCAGGTLDDVAQWPDRIARVTATDVNRAAAKWLEIRRSVTGNLLPREGS